MCVTPYHLSYRGYSDKCSGNRSGYHGVTDIVYFPFVKYTMLPKRGDVQGHN